MRQNNKFMEQHNRPHNFASQGQVDMYGVNQQGAYNRNQPQYNPQYNKSNGSAFGNPPPNFNQSGSMEL